MDRQKNSINVIYPERWKRPVKIAFFFFIIILSMARSAYPERVLKIEIIPGVVNQGEACIIRTSPPASLKTIHAEFREEKIPLVHRVPPGIYEAILGIDLDIPAGKYEIVLKAEDEKGTFYLESKRLRVNKMRFTTQYLTLPPSMVDLDAKTLARVNEEEKRLKVLFQRFKKERLWEGAFIWPLKGEITTPFGLRRIINRQPRSPHSGIDLQAEEGTPVLASNSGVVVLVDELFFSGKSVVLDHGWGIYSMYFHLLETAVGEGNKVKKGDLLGRVGSTGRSTGPHLHWGIRIQGARVDPVSLIRLKEHLSE